MLPNYFMLRNKRNYFEIYDTSAYHVGKINKWIIDRDDLNSFFQSNTHHEATNTAKSSIHQTNSNHYTAIPQITILKICPKNLLSIHTSTSCM